jgi:hypothetical protein
MAEVPQCAGRALRPRHGAFAGAQNAVVPPLANQLTRRAAAFWVLRCAPHPALRAGLLRLTALWLGGRYRREGTLRGTTTAFTHIARPK